MRPDAEQHWQGVGWQNIGWLLPALVLLVYLPSLAFPFQFDDYNVIVENPAVHSLEAWWRSMPGIRPLLKLSYALNWVMTPEPAAFRWVNIGLHAVNALLVWRLLCEFARLRTLPTGVPLMTAALFALHPIQTEAVTYICGRSVTLMACFYLGSLLAWMMAMRTGHLRWRLMAGLAFLCAFLSKETALILPLAAWLISTVLPPSAFNADLNADLKPARPAWSGLLLVAAAAIAFLLTLPAYRDFLSAGLAQRPLVDNLALQANAVFYLASHLLWPAGMNADPALPTSVQWNALLAWQGVWLSALLILAALALRQRSLAAGCVLWFLLHLAPTNSLLPRVDVANDRQLYLASIGVFAALAWVMASAMAWATDWLRQRWRAIAGPARVLPWLPALLLVAMAVWQTIERNRVYRSEVAFWEDVTRKSPWNARAYNNLGYAWQLAGQYHEARAAYQHALRLKPSLAQAHWNLASLPPEAARGPTPEKTTDRPSTDRPSPDRPSSAR